MGCSGLTPGCRTRVPERAKPSSRDEGEGQRRGAKVGEHKRPGRCSPPGGVPEQPAAGPGGPHSEYACAMFPGSRGRILDRRGGRESKGNSGVQCVCDAGRLDEGLQPPRNEAVNHYRRLIGDLRSGRRPGTVLATPGARHREAGSAIKAGADARRECKGQGMMTGSVSAVRAPGPDARGQGTGENMFSAPDWVRLFS